MSLREISKYMYSGEYRRAPSNVVLFKQQPVIPHYECTVSSACLCPRFHFFLLTPRLQNSLIPIPISEPLTYTDRHLNHSRSTLDRAFFGRASRVELRLSVRRALGHVESGACCYGARFFCKNFNVCKDLDCRPDYPFLWEKILPKI